MAFLQTFVSDVGWRPAPLHCLKNGNTSIKLHLVEAVSMKTTQLEKDDLKGQTVTVLGLGASGRAAARLALARGATVVAVDCNESLIPLEILHHAGIQAFVGGNLGEPLSAAALQCLSSSTTESKFVAAVVEVSSYQMEIPNRHFQPSVAVVLNLTPDHLERHKSMEYYAMMKCRVFRHMDSSHLAVLPSGDQMLKKIAYQSGSQGTWAWIGDFPGVKLDSEASEATIVVPTSGMVTQIHLGNLKTIGIHNAYNAGTAALLTLGLDIGVDVEVVNNAMEVLEAPQHRMQVVFEDEHGILWVDDSKATNVDATYAGLQGLKGCPSIVLLGGIAKVLNKEGHIGFERLVDCLNYHKAVITFGASGKKIKQILDEAGTSIPCVEVTSMRDAVSMAKCFAKCGDAIVLSPGCASFDEFDNFEHRGNVFQELAMAS